ARQYTLSDQTAKVLRGLETDLEIILLENLAAGRAQAARDLLELYAAESDRVRLTVIDPEADPQAALAYQEPGQPGIQLGTVLVASGGRRERATAPTEPEVTNAILRILRQDRKKIYFTGGHQEKSIDDTNASAGISKVAEKLRGSTYDPETLVIARSVSGDEMKVPDDADVVVVAGPRSDFLSEEIEALDHYLSSGGRVLFLLDPVTQATTGAIDGYLRDKGLLLGKDVIVDPLSAPPLYPVVRSYGTHPIVESFENAISIFPLARAVERASELPRGVEVRDLFSSEPESWAETRIEELRERQGPAPDQKKGPIPLGAAVTLGPAGSDSDSEKAEPEKEGEESKPPSGRLVVVGDSDFITNELASAPVLNADLFLNMVNWAAEDEDLIAIRPREPEDRRLFLAPYQMTNVLLFSLILVPGVLLVTGISVWWSRR
ncbi:MAG TPA: Gldg family protein, partial [Vicinamibacteria bacterium]